MRARSLLPSTLPSAITGSTGAAGASQLGDAWVCTSTEALGASVALGVGAEGNGDAGAGALDSELQLARARRQAMNGARTAALYSISSRVLDRRA